MAVNDFIKSIGLIGGKPDENQAGLASAYIQRGMTGPTHTNAQNFGNILMSTLGLTMASNQSIARQARQEKQDRDWKEAMFGPAETGIEVAMERFGDGEKSKPTKTPKIIPPEMATMLKAAVGSTPFAGPLAGPVNAATNARMPEQSQTQKDPVLAAKEAAKARMDNVAKVMLDSPRAEDKTFAKNYLLGELQKKSGPDDMQVVGGAIYNNTRGTWMVPPKSLPSHIVAKPGDTVLFPQPDGSNKSVKIPNDPQSNGYLIKERYNPETRKTEYVYMSKSPGGGTVGTGIFKDAGNPEWKNLPPTAQTELWKTHDQYTAQVGKMRDNISKFDPDFLTVPGRAKYLGLRLKDLLNGVIPGIDELTSEDRIKLENQADFLRSSYDQFNTYVKNITGAQMSIHEIARLKKAIAQPGDTPSEYKAKMESLIRVLERTTQQRLKTLERFASGDNVFELSSYDYVLDSTTYDFFKETLQKEFPGQQIFSDGPEESNVTEYDFFGNPVGGNPNVEVIGGRKVYKGR